MGDVIEDSLMFYHDYAIKGGDGTGYDSNNIDSVYARVDDTDEDEPGYFTEDPY